MDGIAPRGGGEGWFGIGDMGFIYFGIFDKKMLKQRIRGN